MKKYHLFSISRTASSEYVVWWREGGSGYTENFAHAGIFPGTHLAVINPSPDVGVVSCDICSEAKTVTCFPKHNLPPRSK